MRGEHEWKIRAEKNLPGSARVRGKHKDASGEHGECVGEAVVIAGSAPRARGAPSSQPGAWRWRGISPACAGSTAVGRATSPRGGDQPRVCGEHLLGIRSGPESVGSAPHVRGAHGAAQAALVVGGISPACAGSATEPPQRSRTGCDQPACAGSTRCRRRCRGGVRDHPRACGEHQHRLALAWVQAGSPPRVRGAP